MAAFAFLFTVAGALDGTTVFTLPNPLPAPTNGVHLITVAGAFGIWDPLDDSAFDTPTAYFIRSLHGEFSAATRFANMVASIPGPGSTSPLIKVVSDPAASPLQRLEMAPSMRVLPKGTRMVFTNAANADGSGGAVAGPHRIYVELETMDSEDDIVTVLEEQAADFAAFAGQIVNLESYQQVAATAIEEFTIPQAFYPSLGIVGATHFEDLLVANGAVAAAGESMTIDVSRVRGGVVTSLLTTPAVIDNTDPGNSIQGFSALIDRTLARTLNPATDKIRITRTYVAGGGPTPMANTVVTLVMEP
jgi:hypothetical protein